MKKIGDIRAGTKIEAIANTLIKDGKITNVQVMQGNPVRTNRLSAVIFTLVEDYGLEIESETLTTEDGKYIDCIYTLIKGESNEYKHDKKRD